MCTTMMTLRRPQPQQLCLAAPRPCLHQQVLWVGLQVKGHPHPQVTWLQSSSEQLRHEAC